MPANAQLAPLEPPWRRLADLLRRAEEPEPFAGCRRCREALPRFVSDELAGRPVDSIDPATAAHLDLCRECLEEYLALAHLLAAALAEEDDHGPA
jgi:hypothetical protein